MKFIMICQCCAYDEVYKIGDILSDKAKKRCKNVPEGENVTWLESVRNKYIKTFPKFTEEREGYYITNDDYEVIEIILGKCEKRQFIEINKLYFCIDELLDVKYLDDICTIMDNGTEKEYPKIYDIYESKNYICTWGDHGNDCWDDPHQNEFMIYRLLSKKKTGKSINIFDIFDENKFRALLSGWDLTISS